MSQRLIAPSILSADFAHLGRDIQTVIDGGAGWIHVDVMDGRFVPNITMGPVVVKAVKRVSSVPVDVHLMIVEPERYIDAFAKAGADFITVHVEATPHVHRAIQQIHSHGIGAGVALNPHTPVSAIEEIVQDLDLILIMSVNPGFGGQKFIENTIGKLGRLRQLLAQKNVSDIYVEVDGGINIKNIERVADAGANVFVAGSAIFKSDSPKEMVAQMRAKLNS